MKQHKVSECYLKAWCDPTTPEGYTAYVWCVPKDGANPYKKAPHRILWSHDIYALTQENGDKDQSVERDLGVLESWFVKVRGKLLLKHELDDREKSSLCEFIAAMLGRTDRYGIGFARGLAQVHEKVKALEARAKSGNLLPCVPASKSGGAQTSSTEICYLAENARPLLVYDFTRNLAPMLFKMAIAFDEAPSNAHFVTSDNPCVMYSSTAQSLPAMYRTPGLAMQDAEITMPLSPKLCARISWDYARQGYHEISSEQVREINRRTTRHSLELVVSFQPETIVNLLST